jgi:sugar phosphate isomerase/epimerase
VRCSKVRLSLCVQTDEVAQAIPVALLTGEFSERARKAALLEADGLELMTINPRSLEVRELRAVLDRYGLDVSAIGSGAIPFATGLTLLHEDSDTSHRAQAILQDLIRFAAGLGAPLVTIGSFRGRLTQAGRNGRERLAEILWTGAEHAREEGVRLVVEPANRYEMDVINNVSEGLTFLAEVRHPALGLLLDTFHVNIEENSWTEPFATALAAQKLWHVHIGDNNRLAPGWGLIDFPAILATLIRMGYDGYLSAELLARPDGDAAAQQTMGYLRPILQEHVCN